MTVANAYEMQSLYEASLRKQRELYGAAPTTIEAVMYSLRERGTAALIEPDCRRRLSELNEQQILDVAVRLQKLKPEIASAWGAEQIDELLKAKAQL
ncbi:MAG TPA: hypothetical protein VIJ35_26790 [Bradyrhizobium sp.]